MKKYIILVGFLLAGSILHAQVLVSLLLGDKLNSPNLEFGIELGYNWSTISKMETNKSLSTFNIGFYFDIRLKNQWFLYTGLLPKAKMGVDKLTDSDLDFLNIDKYEIDGDYSQENKIFLVPLLGKYKFKNRFYIEAGPQFGLVHKAFVEFNAKDDDSKTHIQNYNSKIINRLDVGVKGGVGYKLLKGTGISIGIKYYYGFVNVYKDKPDTKNSSLFLSVNLPIGSHNKDKKTD